MDRRSARTERAVEEAFLRLLRERGYARVTASDVIRAADVGRSTFYAHYGGKEDVLQAVVDSVCAHVLAPAGPEGSHDFSARTDSEAVVEHVLCHLREREGGIRALLFGEGSGLLARCLREEFARACEARLPECPQGPAASLDRAFLVRFLSGSLVDMALWWADDGFAEEPARMAGQYLRCVRPLFSGSAEAEGAHTGDRAS